jgi:plastocyanin
MLDRMSRWAALGLVALALAACTSEPEPAASPQPSPEPSPEASPEPAVEPESPSPEAGPAACEDLTVAGRPEVTITQNDNTFSPDCLIVLGGQGLEIVNEGANLHNFSIEGTDVDLDIRSGKATRTEAIAGIVEPGSYEFFCKFHRSLGMDGEITVSVAG